MDPMSTAAADTTNLAPADIRYIKDHLGEWLTEQSLDKPPAAYEIERRERMIRYGWRKSSDTSAS